VRHGRADELHRVVDRKARVDLAAGAIDVDVDRRFGILSLQVQELGDGEVGDLAVDRRAQEHHPLGEQAGVDVERALGLPFAADDHGDERHGGTSFHATDWLRVSIAL
jgi:hypothetical protein